MGDCVNVCIKKLVKREDVSWKSKTKDPRWTGSFTLSLRQISTIKESKESRREGFGTSVDRLNRKESKEIL